MTEKQKTKLQREKDKNKELKTKFRENKRTILKELDNLKELVKDLMYMGDL